MIASQEDAFIIGGAQIYKEAMEKNVVDQLDITKVDQDFDADVFFPAIDSMVWEEVSRENFSPDEKNLFTYSFINYKKTV